MNEDDFSRLDEHLDNCEYAFEFGLNVGGELDEALMVDASPDLQMFLSRVVEAHRNGNGQQKADVVLGSNQIYTNSDIRPGDWVLYNSDTFFGLRQMNGQVSSVNGDYVTIDGQQVNKENVVKRIEVLSQWRDLNVILKAATSGERGSAKLFAELVEGEILYDNSDGKWYYFNGVYWERDKTKRINNTIADELLSQYSHALSVAVKKYPSTAEGESFQVKTLAKAVSALNYRNRISNVMEMAKSEQSLVISGDEWTRNSTWLLGCENGVIDLKTGCMRPGNPSDYIRDVCPTLWQGDDCPCPRFEQFMSEVFAGDIEKIEFVQRLLGYSLIGQQIDHVLPIFCGEDGRNGKSVLLNILRHVLGPYMTAASEEVLLSGKKNPGAATPFLTMLQGKRIAYITETNEGDVIDSGVVKLLTGNDAIVARKLYGESFTFVPSHTIFLITNHKPHAPSDDEALWERVVLIEFTQRFVDEPTEPNEHKRDPYLMRQLEKEASGILAWLVRGCVEWHKQGLNPPQSVKMATESYRQSEDTLGQFLEERCLIHPDEQVQAKVFYDAYRDWSIEGSMKPMRSIAFAKRMGKRFQKKRKESGKFYLGVSVRPPEIVEQVSRLFSKNV